MAKEVKDNLTKIQFWFLLFLGILIVILALLMIAFFKYGKAIANDPLIYGMNKHNYSYCECLDKDNITWKSSPRGFYRLVTVKPFEYNVSG